MATIIKQLELFSSCKNAQEIKFCLKNYVNHYLGHAVKDITDAREFYSEESLDALKYGESQYVEFELDNGSARISIRITEIYVDAGSTDYCYEIKVEEV